MYRIRKLRVCQRASSSCFSPAVKPGGVVGASRVPEAKRQQRQNQGKLHPLRLRLPPPPQRRHSAPGRTGRRVSGYRLLAARDGSGSGTCGYGVCPPESIPASPAFACPRAKIPARTRARRISAGTGKTRHPREPPSQSTMVSPSPTPRLAEVEAEATPGGCDTCLGGCAERPNRCCLPLVTLKNKLVTDRWEGGRDGSRRSSGRRRRLGLRATGSRVRRTGS
jgi:hypothetical protein